MCNSEARKKHIAQAEAELASVGATKLTCSCAQSVVRKQEAQLKAEAA